MHTALCAKQSFHVAALATGSCLYKNIVNSFSRMRNTGKPSCYLSKVKLEVGLGNLDSLFGQIAVSKQVSISVSNRSNRQSFVHLENTSVLLDQPRSTHADLFLQLSQICTNLPS